MDLGNLSGFSTAAVPYNPAVSEATKRAAAGSERTSEGVNATEFDRAVVRGEAVADDDIRSRDNQQASEEKRQEAEVREMQQRERDVIAHENAHRAAGAGLVRGGSYEYAIGPDGKRYIAGGEVTIDTSPVPDNPEATIRKADQIIKAALAPVDPSPQDRAAAADARAMRANAQAELQRVRYEESRGESDSQAMRAPGMQLDLRA